MTLSDISPRALLMAAGAYRVDPLRRSVVKSLDKVDLTNQPSTHA